MTNIIFWIKSIWSVSKSTVEWHFQKTVYFRLKTVYFEFQLTVYIQFKMIYNLIGFFILGQDRIPSKVPLLSLIVYYQRPVFLRPYTLQNNCFCCGLICIIQLEINKQACRVLLNSVVIIGFCGNGVKDAVWHVKRNLKKTDLIFPHHQIQNKHIGTVATTWCPLSSKDDVIMTSQ